MSEWNKTTLGEFISLQRGHDLPTKIRTPGKIPVIGSGGINGWHNEAKAQAPGVTIGRAANLGEPQFLQNDFWPLNTTLYVTDFKGNDVRFVYNLFKTIDLTGFNSGSVQPMLNRNYIQNFPIVAPSPEEQRSISSTLGALDDKITVNERISNISEELCRNLVTANSNKTPRTMIEEICVLKKQQTAPSTLNEATAHHYSLPAFDKGKLPEATDPKSIKSNKFIVASPSVLISKLNPEIPRVWNVPKVDSIPNLASTEFLVLEPVRGVSTHELWAVTSQPEFTNSLATRVTGTSKSHQRVRPAEVLATEVVDPRKLGHVREQIAALSSRSIAAINESRTLAELRDTLLPQLMSGKLRVKDAEKIVEDNV